MQPAAVSHLRAADFGDATACLGKQVSKIIRKAVQILPDLCWYIADVQTTGLQVPEWQAPSPTRIADTAEMLQLIEKVDQFEAGVFAGVPITIVEPNFREGGLWTEDEEFADLGDAILEIRTFDTSYLTVASTDALLVRRIERSVENEKLNALET